MATSTITGVLSGPPNLTDLLCVRPSAFASPQSIAPPVVAIDDVRVAPLMVRKSAQRHGFPDPAARDAQFVMRSVAAQFLSSRSWKGSVQLVRDPSDSWMTNRLPPPDNTECFLGETSRAATTRGSFRTTSILGVFT